MEDFYVYIGYLLLKSHTMMHHKMNDQTRDDTLQGRL